VIEPATLDSLGVLPVAIADNDARDGAAKPGEVLQELLLHLPANVRARAHKRRRNRRVHLGLVRGVLPEHPRYALVVRRRVPQHRREVRRGRGAHRECLRQCGRVDTCDGHVRRVPLQRPEQRPLACLQLADILHGRVRDAAQPEPALVDRLRCEEERGGHCHHWPLEEDAERAGVGERVARLCEDVLAESAVAVESEREGDSRWMGLLVLIVDGDEMGAILAEESGARGLA